MLARGSTTSGARYYDPATGRFTQLDPLGGGYAYGSNDPVNRLDPSGLADFQPIPIFEELCGFGAGYYPEVVGTTTCVNYRNARVTGIADYYYFGAPRPVQHDFDRAFGKVIHAAGFVPVSLGGCASGFKAGTTIGEYIPSKAVQVGLGAGGCLLGAGGALRGYDYFGPSNPNGYLA